MPFLCFRTFSGVWLWGRGAGRVEGYSCTVLQEAGSTAIYHISAARPRDLFFLLLHWRKSVTLQIRPTKMANVEDYEVLDWVGGGSFGSVSRVRRKRDDVVVCWKRVQYGGFSEAEKRAVVAEVNCLRELHSPFVVRFLDRVVDRKTTTIYIVMEFCEGGDLAQLLDSLRKRSTDSSPCFLEESKVTRFCLLAYVGHISLICCSSNRSGHRWTSPFRFHSSNLQDLLHIHPRPTSFPIT